MSGNAGPKPMLARDDLNALAEKRYGKPWNEITPAMRREIVDAWVNANVRKLRKGKDGE